MTPCTNQGTPSVATTPRLGTPGLVAGGVTAEPKGSGSNPNQVLPTGLRYTVLIQPLWATETHNILYDLLLLFALFWLVQCHLFLSSWLEDGAPLSCDPLKVSWLVVRCPRPSGRSGGRVSEERVLSSCYLTGVCGALCDFNCDYEKNLTWIWKIMELLKSQQA